jgi:acylpyruvate hydrolase
VAEARVPPEMIALLNGGEASLEAVRRALAFAQEAGESLAGQGVSFAAGEVTLLAPVLRPGKIICLGLNYKAHAAEAQMEVPKYPILFHKVATSIIGHRQNIIKPRITRRLDYEGELAVIIGRRGKHIAEAEALSYVAGYACSNDVSARDLQFRTNQWTAGKMMDTACPLGPALVTRDEIPDPNALQLKTTLNGQVMQNSNTAEMIFNVAFTVSYISQIATLEPGDVILTGTPEGIGGTRNPPVLMQAGDTISVEIEGLGTLTNAVIDEE